MNRAVFIDKDGTLVENVPYNIDPRKIRFTQGAIAALRGLRAGGYRVVLVTNQSGVGRGLFTERELVRYLRSLEELLGMAGITLDAIEYCPHEIGSNHTSYRRACSCRKPNPGMLLRAARRLNLDLESSWMIGDTPADVEAGRRAGCRTVLVGDDRIHTMAEQRRPDFFADTLEYAVTTVLEESGARVIEKVRT